MAIYERGYRPYEGGFGGPSAWRTILAEGLAQARRHRGVRITFWIIVMIFAGTLVTLFVELGRTGGDRAIGARSQLLLRTGTAGYFSFSTHLVLLTGVMVGASLVSNDLRSRALTLYLVRPMRRWDYVLGKALVVPGAFLALALLPPLLIWLFVGLWQPPGQTGAWLAENADYARRAFEYWLSASAAITGLTLLISSLTPRSGLATVLGAGVVFGGVVPNSVGRMLGGDLGQVIRGLDLAAAVQRAGTAELSPLHAAYLPEAHAAAIAILAVFAAGLLATWWRTRTVELGE